MCAVRVACGGEGQPVLSLLPNTTPHHTILAERRMVEVKKTREEVLKANASAITRKERIKQQEKVRTLGQM